MGEPAEEPTVGFCSACGGARLEALPPNWITHNPGYSCSDCGTAHRSRKARWVSTGMLVLGLTCSGAGFTMMFMELPRHAGLPGKPPVVRVAYGLIAVGWAAWQLQTPPPADAPR